VIWHRSIAVMTWANQLSRPALECVVNHMKTHLVLIVLVQVDAALLRFSPPLWYSVIDIGLVNDFGDELGPLVNAWRIRGRDLGAVNGVGRAVLDEQSKEGEDGAYEEDYY
jgi:hypothetical protein